MNSSFYGKKTPGFGLPFFAIHLFVSPLNAQSPATTQRLTVLRSAYEAAYQKEVAAIHSASLADLDGKYTAALDRALAAATQAGQLDTAVALRDEKKRVAEKAALPADDFAAPESLKTLRLTYRSALASLEAKRDQLAAPVKAKYDTALETLQTELTKAGDLDGALAVKALRTDLASLGSSPDPIRHSMPESPATASGVPAQTGSSRLEKVPAKTDPEAAKQMLAWVLANDASSVTSAGRIGMKEKIKEAPKGRFAIKTLYFNDASNSFPWELLPKLGEISALNITCAQLISADQLKHVSSLPLLDELIIKAPLTLKTLEALSVNDHMRNLSIQQTGEDDLNPAVPSLAQKFPKLDMLSWCPREGQDNLAACLAAQAWPKLHYFRCRGDLSAGCVEALAGLKELTNLTLLGNGTLNPANLHLLQNLEYLNASFGKHLPGLVSAAAKLPRLKTFRCALEARSPADLADLPLFPSLDILTLKFNAPAVPADDFMSTVTKIKNITQLDLLQSDLSDAGLAQLQDMKKLTKLVLPGSRVTEAGLSAFKKALPKCQISREVPNY